MITTGLIYLILITLLYLVVFRKAPEKGRQSLLAARQTLWRMIPLLLAIFALIGLFQEFVPHLSSSPLLVTIFFFSKAEGAQCSHST